jgi:hypothetical protein
MEVTASFYTILWTMKLLKTVLFYAEIHSAGCTSSVDTWPTLAGDLIDSFGQYRVTMLEQKESSWSVSRVVWV